MSINAINTNLFGISAKTNLKTQVSVEENKTEEKSQTTQTERKQLSADDVFKYMTATRPTAPVQLKKTVNVKAYVNQESASRILSSMKDFEAQFSDKLSAVKSEFGNISDDLAKKITLKMF